MARPSKKAISKAQAQRQVLRQWLDRLPPDVAAAAVLAGTAAMAGFTPPFSRLLIMTASRTEGQKDPVEDVHNFWEILSPGYALISWLVGEPDGTSSPPPEANLAPDKALKAIGLFCMAALEGAMMYNAMKNPEVLTTMIKAPAEMLKAVGSIVPG